MKKILISFQMFLTVALVFTNANAQTTAFSYQGNLNLSGSPANGDFDFEFTLFDAASGGDPLGATLTKLEVAVSSGNFTTDLDFGSAAFDGNNRWLEIAVKSNLEDGPYNTLLPRQLLTPAPYAIRAASATLAQDSISAQSYAGSIETTQLTGEIPLANIGNASITNAKLAANSVTAVQIADGAVLEEILAVDGPGSGINADLLDNLNSSAFWNINGNSGTTVGTHFVGTTDNRPLDLRTFNQRALRLQATSDGANSSVNIIGGSPLNQINGGASGATISGGGSSATGAANQISGSYGTIGGGTGNTISGAGISATIAGGANNAASGFNSTIGGGGDNISSSTSSTVAGGFDNTASGSGSTIGGGINNTAENLYGTVSGGEFNEATGSYATVPGGNRNSAADYAFAAGRRAQAVHRGAFVWGDSTDANIASTGDNQFTVRAYGGVRFISGSGVVTPGVELAPNATSWATLSDENSKKNISPVDTQTILDKLNSVAVKEWNYNWESETETPHIGPMAQDFKSAFYPGRDDTRITTLEFDGVALAAIQALTQMLEEKETRITEMEQRLERLENLLTTSIK